MRYPTIKIALLTSVLLTFIGCDKPREPAPKPENRLMKRLEAQAAARPPRASMSFGFTHELSDIEPGGPVGVETPDGTHVEVTGAWLVVSALEAHLCEPKLSENRGTWLELADDLLIPSAHAHVPNSATRLGVPFVENLFGEGGKASIVGEVAPPLGEYCTFYAIVSPADDDVLNLTDLPTSEIVEKTLVLRGTVEHEDATREFVSNSTRRDVVEFPAVDPNTGEPPLEMNEPQATQMILLGKTVSPELFADIPTAKFGGSGAADIVLERLEPTFRVKRFKSSKD